MPRRSTRNLFIRLICIPVLAILLMPLALQPFRQMIFRSQVHLLQTINPDSSGLQTFVFSQAEFEALRFVRPGREFVYQERQYDVCSIRHTGSSVEIKALWDAPETAILSTLSPAVTQPGPVPPSFGSIGFMPYFPPVTGAFQFDPPSKSLHGKFNLVCNYQDISLMLVYPPPELLTLS